MTWQVINGNSAEILKQYPDNSFDAVVTDPPYGINFLGKSWDSNVGEEEVYRQCYRVLKPGGHILAFSAARTYHHLAMTIERAGFEVRDQIMWIYGSGFPKSQDIGRQIDKSLGLKGTKGPLKRGAERLINSTDENGNRDNNGMWGNEVNRESHIILPESEAAKRWSGWGTQLKPAHEPICMARKPLDCKNIADNAQRWGVGALNIDACRVGDAEERTYPSNGMDRLAYGETANKWEKNMMTVYQGRFPANIIHDGSDEVVNMFPDNCGNAAKATRTKDSITGTGASLVRAKHAGEDNGFYDGLGSAARFFYSAKVSRKERQIGCNDGGPLFTGVKTAQSSDLSDRRREILDAQVEGSNNHPTVKPVELMKYLIKLVAPQNSTILDPFNGSGSTGMAAVELGHNYVGIELDPHYCEIARRRIAAWQAETVPFANNPLFEVKK